jgi:hypothetical protein
MSDKQASKTPAWWQLQSGQALAEYWPTIPAAIMVMIVAAAIAGPIGHIFHRTSDALNLVVCGQAPPAYFTLPIGSVVEVLGTDYDSKHDRSTFTLGVPEDGQVILGLTQEEIDRIAQSSENYNVAENPDSGETSISFDADSGVQTSDGREITLTLTGQVDFVDNMPVTVIDDNNNATSGYIYTTVSYTGEDCANQSSKTWGNNGVGNGFDDQPPGQPPENDTCADAAPGSPCNKGLGKTK